MSKPASKVARKTAAHAASGFGARSVAKKALVVHMAAPHTQKAQRLITADVFSQPTAAQAHVSPPKRIPKLAFAELAAMDGLARDKAVRGGLPVALLDEAAHIVGVSQNTLLGALGIATSTASRRKANDEPLSVEESDRVARLARLWQDVMTVFQDEEGAKAWLNGRVPVLGAVPLQLLATSDGFEQARTAIQRLAYGVYA